MSATGRRYAFEGAVVRHGTERRIDAGYPEEPNNTDDEDPPPAPPYDGGE